MSPLAFLQEGETAVIVAPDVLHRTNIHGNRHRHRNCHYSAPCNDRHCLHHGDGSFSAYNHLLDMGLRPGKKVEMITNSGTGPLVLRIDECRIAMGRGAAMKIYVRRNTQ
ncbi:MAG: hypothetical protein APR62_01910 [Smithella sp. SDB]|nr:MAG: hypothetical protein APR62_01910 [Smithella sp. SDB]